MAWLAKTGLTEALDSLTPVPPPAAAAPYDYRRRQLWTMDAMVNPGRRRPPWLVAEVLRTVRPLIDFVKALSDRFRLTCLDRTPLLTNLRKGGGVHTFLGRLMSEVAPVPGLTELTLLGVDQNGEAHILHSFFSVPVSPYDPDRRLFGCCGELPTEGLPAITKIPVDFFGAHHAPPGASGRIPPLWMSDDAMQEGEQQGRGTEPLLTGTQLPPSRYNRAPLPSGKERRRVL